MGLAVGDGVNQLFVYPARVRSSGEFTQAVIHVTDARCRRGDEGPRRGVRGVRHAGDADRERRCCDAGWRRGGVVQGLGRQPGRRCSSLRRISRVSELPRRVAYPAPKLVGSHIQNWWICVGRAIRAESTPSRAKSALGAKLPRAGGPLWLRSVTRKWSSASGSCATGSVGRG